MCPVRGTRTLVGLMPAMPLLCDGPRIDPPQSEPMSNAARPAATDRAGTAGGSRGAAGQVVGIVRGAVQQVAGRADSAEAAERELGSVGLAEQNRAGGAHARDDRRVFLRHVLLAAVGRAGRDHAGGVERILDGHRHAVQRAREVAARGSRVERFRFLARTRVAVHHDGVQHVVDGELPLDERFDGLHRRNLPRTEQLRELRRGHEDQIGRLVGGARRGRRARRHAGQHRRHRDGERACEAEQVAPT